MRRLIFILMIVGLASCEKETDFRGYCDIYGIKSHTYNPYGPMAEIELYMNVSRDEASDRLSLFRTKYTQTHADTFNKIKAAHPGAFIDCGLEDLQ